MALVLAAVADLLFGSRVQGSLSAAGHDVQLIGDEPTLRRRLAESAADSGAVLVADLSDSRLDAIATLQALAAEHALERIRTLGFYAHVHADQRERAQAAGFDLVVPRSRLAREGPQLIERLAATLQQGGAS